MAAALIVIEVRWKFDRAVTELDERLAAADTVFVRYEDVLTFQLIRELVVDGHECS